MRLFSKHHSLEELTSRTYNFFSWAQNAQFSKAHVEGRALEGAIGLSYYDDVDAARQRGLVDPLVQLLHRHQHLARQLPHVVHGVALSVRAESEEAPVPRGDWWWSSGPDRWWDGSNKIAPIEATLTTMNINNNTLHVIFVL